jgi:hypothetical protein
LLACSGVVRHTIDVQLSGISSHRSHKAQGSWGHQQLMEKFHFGLTPKIEELDTDVALNSGGLSD